MQKNFSKTIKNFFSFVVIAILVGCFSGLVVTLFKLAAEKIIHFSIFIYNFVRHNQVYSLPLIISALILGLIAYLIVNKFENCKGGGIPASVAAIRGLFEFKWFSSIIILSLSAMLTFLFGIPLGTEGPSVQIGAAVGDVLPKKMLKNKYSDWRRNFVSGGAAAGFAIATACPISAVVFSFEELNKYCSPKLALGTVLSVSSANATMKLFSLIGISSGKLFDLPPIDALPLSLLFIPLLLGIICGLISILFTKFYHLINKFVRKISKANIIKIIFPIIFATTSLLGIYLPELLGTGHSLTEELINTKPLWYTMLLVLLARCCFMLFSNSIGVTGGIFLPTITIGAIIGALFANTTIVLDLVPANYYMLLVTLGVVSFLGATSRIPITAFIFALEALNGTSNIIAIIIAVSAAYTVIKLSKLEDFTDTVIKAKFTKK